MKEHLFMAGPVIYPLLFCSVVVSALVMQRLVVLIMYPALRAEQHQQNFIRDEWVNKSSEQGLAHGIQLLVENKLEPKAYRDDLLSSWLLAEKRKLLRGAKILMLLGTLTPLLGLLGTVLGIINMFQNVAHETGPVTPALLASGMWEAMVTTALGMLIAIPALAAGQGFTIWGNSRIGKMEEVLNTCSLSLEKNQTPQEKISHKIIKSTSFGSSDKEEMARLELEGQIA